MSMTTAASMAQIPRPTPMAAGAYTRESWDRERSTLRQVMPKNTAKATRPRCFPWPALEQVGGGLQAGPRLILLGAGHQHREDLFFVRPPEPLRVPRQQPPGRETAPQRRPRS